MRDSQKKRNEKIMKRLREAKPRIGPPVAVLASHRDWSLSITLYPSGPCMELVECIEGKGARLAWSEPMANIERAVLRLKQENGDA